MEADARNTKALLKRIDVLTSHCVRHYVAILDLASKLPQTDVQAAQEDENMERHPDRTQAAVNNLKMDIEKEAMIKATEDILSLSRQLKELWLFGKLDTLRESGIEKETEENARAVSGLLAKVLENRLGNVEGTTTRSTAAAAGTTEDRNAA